MKRFILSAIAFLLIFVLLTQVGWLSNGFFGFQIGFLPEGSGWAVFWGAIVALMTLAILKLIRWWKK